MKSNEAEFIQKRFLVGAGPSSNTWPRWAAHLEHRTSVRTKPGRVKTNNIFAPTLYLHGKSTPRRRIYSIDNEWWCPGEFTPSDGGKVRIVRRRHGGPRSGSTPRGAEGSAGGGTGGGRARAGGEHIQDTLSHMQHHRQVNDSCDGVLSLAIHNLCNLC